MEVILTSIFSAFIIFMCVFQIIRALGIGYKRKEITYGKYIIYIILSVMIGLLIALILPFVYQKIFELIM